MIDIIHPSDTQTRVEHASRKLDNWRKTMTTATRKQTATASVAKRIAATILKQDMEIVTEYWQERNAEVAAIMSDELKDEIQAELESLLEDLMAKVSRKSMRLVMSDVPTLIAAK